jgi:hypothetical protein
MKKPNLAIQYGREKRAVDCTRYMLYEMIDRIVIRLRRPGPLCQCNAFDWLRSVAAAWMIGVASSAHCADSQVDMGNWKLFRSETIGFEARHPASWQARHSTGTIESVILGETPSAVAPAKSVQFIVQRAANPKRLSIRQWYAEELGKFKSAAPTSADTTLAGRPAIRVEHTGTLGKQFMIYTLLGATDIFQVSIRQASGEAQIDPLYAAVLGSVRLAK